MSDIKIIKEALELPGHPAEFHDWDPKPENCPTCKALAALDRLHGEMPYTMPPKRVRPKRK